MVTDLFAMGRPRESMTHLMQGDLRDRVQEHLWKVFAYHNIHSTDHWLDELNAWLEKCQRFNLKKGTKSGKNYTLDQLKDLFVTELFEDGDIKLLNIQWSRKGYPFIKLSSQDCDCLRYLAEKYAACIYYNTVFSTNKTEFLT